MIVVLGETAAAREMNNRLSAMRAKTVRVDVRESLVYVWRETGEFSEKIPFTMFFNWLANQACSAVVEASHPSCSQSFQPLRSWCKDLGVPYIRLERPETKIPASPLVYAVADWEEALSALKRLAEDKDFSRQSPFTVFVTTGSHQLESLVNAPFARDVRWVVRVLPEGRLVQKCQDLGIPPKDIVAMQGPFSKELNRILLKAYGAHVLLTRDSGPAGGTDTKISAALALGLDIVLLKRLRPEADPTVPTAHSVNEVISWLHKVTNIPFSSF
ncbi:MAG: precorrin-6A reductase [Desulfitobacteriaceae bacterium]|nr:precorrin-6A reductase [Desulfitobacteriaceae bacterium]MDI6914733.1 precorrin-6A reductase [Desulfitobacteriaceae bacterium]